jgi:ASC-1-like (ASCH) protein
MTPDHNMSPQKHEMHVFGQTLKAIAKGEKTYELRIAYPPFEKICVGDVLHFGEGVEKMVAGIERFTSIEACVHALGVNSILPGYTPDQAACVWATREDVQKNIDGFHILAFRLE